MRGPKVTNKPVTAADEDEQEVARSVNPPARTPPLDHLPDVAVGDPDSIAAWHRRMAEDAEIAKRKAEQA